MKYIFFDIDGTLVSVKDGKEYIPESTLRTIKALQDKGHVTAIASGRSMLTVKPVAEKLGIHYIVTVILKISSFLVMDKMMLRCLKRCRFRLQWGTLLTN